MHINLPLQDALHKKDWQVGLIVGDLMQSRDLLVMSLIRNYVTK